MLVPSEVHLPWINVSKLFCIQFEDTIIAYIGVIRKQSIYSLYFSYHDGDNVTYHCSPYESLFEVDLETLEHFFWAFTSHPT